MSTHVNILTREIIGAAIEVHRHLGPGLLESAYRRCLMQELSLRGISFESELPVSLQYKGMQLESGYRLDLLIQDAVVVETKSVEAFDESA